MITKSPEETIEAGRKYAGNLKGGEVIGLIGELGGGKTVFVKGLAEGLGIKDLITSPTFVLLKEYKLSPRHLHLEGVKTEVLGFMVHVDAYRVESFKDIKSIGIEDYLGRDNTIVIVEWAEKIRKTLPKNTIYIKFNHINENVREIILR